MQRFVPATFAAIITFATPALADKLPLPKAAYSADVIFVSKGKETPGHINVDGPKERRETRNAAGQPAVTLIRRDQGRVYDLKLKRHLAVSLRIAAAEAAGEIGAPGTDIDAFYGAEAESQGLETIDGLLTTKYAIKIDGGPDLMVNATVWATDDGIIVRVVGKTSIDGDNAPARMDLKNIQRGPQDAALFELPPGMELLSADGESDTPIKPTGPLSTIPVGPETTAPAAGATTAPTPAATPAPAEPPASK
jgi:hypothetical protein